MVTYYRDCGYNVSGKLEQVRPNLLRRKKDLKMAEIRKQQPQNLDARLRHEAKRLYRRIISYTKAEDNRSKVGGSDWLTGTNDLRLEQPSLADERSKGMATS